ncbi:hypothetical protein HO173_009359 [Letharia columbiana]|uniref:Nucleoside-diphosphate-sugar epimerase n=1 Tax=Letharia columbiana TaxID=112416 RepID=A0A8H6FPU7_9LECA|nr:uncharacterized protein HO173_009359 [Letharia columbiana]KAF6232479.1 hypothetical protein HO173_009359 [Letharia columbiana]
MHLILTGATGLVGSACLHQMLTNNLVTTVSILSRRPVPMAEGHPKVKTILHTDFNQYPTEVLNQLKGATGCVWALGVSVNDVSKEFYEEIVVSYPLAAAKAFASLSESFNFVYVSGEGATTTPGRFTPFFGRVKGRIEAQLQALSTEPAYASLKVYSLRPAGVDPKFHEEIHGWIPKLKPAGKAVGYPIVFTILRTVNPGFISPTRELGKVLVDLAMNDGKPLSGAGVLADGRTISNLGMRRLAGL